jgi:hypothetical protein
MDVVMVEEDRTRKNLVRKEICGNYPRQSGMDSPSFAGNYRSWLSVTVSLTTRDLMQQFWYARGRLE